ncbi:hypothetical protein ElyMa_000493100 [Elysia marginata]|uniref:Uncharacterized protein n=1 Tax=Elysia marginata TaxID=1093978 RepID=A0AAV4FU04_9GAST|nr:hypothetical protein ElyMa_000493100 [Elysia marginata]
MASRSSVVSLRWRPEVHHHQETGNGVENAGLTSGLARNNTRCPKSRGRHSAVDSRQCGCARPPSQSLGFSQQQEDTQSSRSGDTPVPASQTNVNSAHNNNVENNTTAPMTIRQEFSPQIPNWMAGFFLLTGTLPKEHSGNRFVSVCCGTGVGACMAFPSALA